MNPRGQRKSATLQTRRQRFSFEVVGPKYSTALRKRVSAAVSKPCGGRFSMMELRHARLHPLRPTFSLCDGPSQSRVVAPERIRGIGKPHSEGTPPDSFAAVGCGEVDTGGDRQTARAEGAERGCSYCETGHHPGMVPAAHCPQV